MKLHSPGRKREDPVVAHLLATGSDPKKRERGRGEMVCLCRGYLGESCFTRGYMMQIYVDNDRDKVGVVEKEECVEFIDAVDFDFVFDFPHAFDFLRSFVFSDFSIFRRLQCLGRFGQSGEALTLYKKKADKVRAVSRSYERGLRPEGKGNWRAEAISKECYKPGGAYYAG